MSPPKHQVRNISEEDPNGPFTLGGGQRGSLRTLITSPEDETLRKRGRRRYRQDRRNNGGTATGTERSTYNPASTSCPRGNEQYDRNDDTQPPVVMQDDEQIVYDVQLNTSKLNYKSRENSFLGQMTRMEEEYIEEIKATTKEVNPQIQDVVFLSGVGYKTVRSSVERERSK